MVEPQSSPPHPIRDDVTGSLSASLERHLDCARLLLASAEQVTSHRDFDAWREERHAWRRRSAQMINFEFEQEAIHEFVRVTMETSGEVDWEQALAEALRGMRTAIELLTLLQSTLIAGGKSRCTRRVDRFVPQTNSELRVRKTEEAPSAETPVADFGATRPGGRGWRGS